MTEQTLAEVVLDLADNDAELPEAAKLVILGALEGDEALDHALGIDTGSTRPPPEAKPREPEPAGAFLTSIEVSGFRGIGPRSTLPLHPGPGLTVVAGRNGSGKSSFSEALELALTGESYRWRAEKNAIWRDAWQNIHQGTPCQIRIGLAEEGRGSTKIGVDWPEDGTLHDREAWVQRAGQKREAGLATLGWGTALDLYRPILSSDELGTLLEAKSSRLFDELENLLGLQVVKDAQARLTSKLKEFQLPEAAAKAAKNPLKEALESSEDERAVIALAQVRKLNPDLDAVARLAAGTGAQPVGELARLRALAEVRIPTHEEVERVAESLRSAVGVLAELGVPAMDLPESRNALLAQAMELHAQHGDMTCPACGEGRFDSSWYARAAEQLAKARADLAEVRNARAALQLCREKARALAGISTSFATDGVELASVARASAAQERWNEAPADDRLLADHLTSLHAELVEAFAAVRAEAAALLEEREDAWTPIAQKLAEWAMLKQHALAHAERTKTVQKAVNWLKRKVAVLRNQSLEPLADAARAIWSKLRQESNVGIGAITLEGQHTSRRVELRADVDGEEAQALSVMSRGELHALALALFLPRATLKTSPLRFVVLDDPVQAMDPTKVDGFAQVLAQIAEERQVVVFSHDDRLADAVRRIDPKSRIVEVTRASDSKVTVNDSRTPAYRYIDDARAIASDRALKPDVVDKVLPGLCRLALEAAAHEVFVRRRHLIGHDRAATEICWSKATKTSQRVALAIHDDAGMDLRSWSNSATWRKATLDNCARGVHAGLGANPHRAVDALTKTVEDVLGRPR
ncbi:AAA family ATPase [Amycolatopsis keratiniphila]|uniref:AAA family ATPase n=1 Tax=Amycolatopsis keratiniphila TaxID=129921 RepID=UPI00087B5C0B|nr:AAA family ATPase [Amycolatopsis keratiniphila]OLZ51895.1 hypothetical protein BS330_24960 [Amycolatopsis keratiniphila subsp. nogabecina]SDU62183.1 AAA domain-containing protein [Amycolatopsis keratiniphila]